MKHAQIRLSTYSMAQLLVPLCSPGTKDKVHKPVFPAHALFSHQKTITIIKTGSLIHTKVLLFWDSFIQCILSSEVENTFFVLISPKVEAKEEFELTRSHNPFHLTDLRAQLYWHQVELYPGHWHTKETGGEWRPRCTYFVLIIIQYQYKYTSYAYKS